MKLRWKAAIGNLAAALFIAGPAFAQDPAPAAPAAQPAVVATEPGSIVEGSTYCAACQAAAEEGGDEDAPWELTNLFTNSSGRNFLADNGFSLRGNLAQSYVFNFAGPSDRFNGPVTWTDRSNEYQLNQFYTTFERVTNTEEKFFDIGGRVDVLAGTNARFVQAYGMDLQWAPNNSFYGVVMPQAYGEIATGKIKTKVGRFFSPVGYFGVNSADNFFFSLPYTYQHGEPFTHTGTLSTYTGDNFSVGAGVIRGWDNFNSQNPLASPGLGFLGTASYTFEGGASVGFVWVYSNEANQNVFVDGAQQHSPRFLQTFVYQKPIGEKMSYVFQSDFGNQTKALTTGKSAQWYGINQYLFYDINDKWTFGTNFEWFQDDDGFRVGGFLPLTGLQNYRGLPLNRVGYEGSFFQLTVGPKWTPNPNLIVRPNLRFDWFTGEATNGGGLRPFDDGTRNTQILLGTDVIIRF
ncbi:porin [bacterium]|nr:porin [bacterium]